MLSNKRKAAVLEKLAIHPAIKAGHEATEAAMRAFLKRGGSVKKGKPRRSPASDTRAQPKQKSTAGMFRRVVKKEKTPPNKQNLSQLLQDGVKGMS